MPSTTAWRRLLVAGSAAMLTLACTGGDDGAEVIVDGGETDPSAVVAAAGGRTEVTSGRVRYSAEIDFSSIGPLAGPDEAASNNAAPTMRVEFEGAFSGSSIDVEGVVGFDAPDAGEAVDERFRLIEFDGVAYTDSTPGMAGMGSELSDLAEQLRAAAGSRTWFESPPVDRASAESDPSEMFGLDTPNRALQILGELDEVRELEPVRVDEVELARFAGRAGIDTYEKPGTGENAGDDEGVDPARQERIDEYRDAHQWLEVEVLIDPEGYVRQLDLRSRDEVEDRYRDCIALFGIGDATASVEFWDLGARVEIVAPDPADVMPYEEQERIMNSWSESGQALLPDDGALAGEEPVTVVAGSPMPPEERAYWEEFLRVAYEESGRDPASIPSMTDQELLVAATAHMRGSPRSGTDDQSEDLDDWRYAGCPE